MLSNDIPAHLRFKEKERLYYQRELYSKFGVIALDFTDKHSAGVLKELLFLLKNSLGAQITKKLNVKYLYSFRGHDKNSYIAAYHPEMKSLSIGGEKSYGQGDLSEHIKIKLLSSFAHEMGHAFIFNALTPKTLAEVASRFGNWSPVLKGRSISSLYQAPFFIKNPLRRHVLSLDDKNAKQFNYASNYGLKNIHEWFSDAFASFVLNKMGNEGHLGKDWKSKLIKDPKKRNSYWTNYNNITNSLKKWFTLSIDSFLKAN